jgi:hypothetical protein
VNSVKVSTLLMCQYCEGVNTVNNVKVSTIYIYSYRVHSPIPSTLRKLVRALGQIGPALHSVEVPVFKDQENANFGYLMVKHLLDSFYIIVRGQRSCSYLAWIHTWHGFVLHSWKLSSIALL